MLILILKLLAHCVGYALGAYIGYRIGFSEWFDKIYKYLTKS